MGANTYAGEIDTYFGWGKGSKLSGVGKYVFFLQSSYLVYIVKVAHLCEHALTYSKKNGNF